jgi:hypothetical protein
LKLLSELKRVSNSLAAFPGHWALCGGVAASIYRKKPRFTDDIDFILSDSPSLPAKEIASQVIANLGYAEYLGFVPVLFNDNEQVLGLCCARTSTDKNFIGIDFLLPVQFWVNDAVKAAQGNLIDFGFAVLPTITPEHLIIAKCAAALSNPERFQDLDDLKEITNSVSLNLEFIDHSLQSYGIVLTPELKKLVFKA